ncbi:hypothetical protein [Siccirubricoccus sp. G192]|uniref:hypothetical protein n=1 Tax=Siccirubricoccus sp. G192 TaxID=2849651 RepID=UPI001C2B8F88|nr:hypothetical protein [Siccirubricoccus sp. G192]MBV1800292.1 hypothetical protein [Siccirubricoccus sp. G192]
MITPAGELSIFSFSGAMILDEAAEIFRMVGNYRGHKVALQPPVRIAKPTWRPIPQFDSESFANIFVGSPPMSGPFKMAALPNLVLGQAPSIKLAFGDEDAGQFSRFKDTLIVEFYGSQSTEVNCEKFPFLHSLTGCA